MWHNCEACIGERHERANLKDRPVIAVVAQAGTEALRRGMVRFCAMPKRERRRPLAGRGQACPLKRRDEFLVEHRRREIAHRSHAENLAFEFRLAAADRDAVLLAEFLADRRDVDAGRGVHRDHRY